MPIDIRARNAREEHLVDFEHERKHERKQAGMSARKVGEKTQKDKAPRNAQGRQLSASKAQASLDEESQRRKNRIQPREAKKTTGFKAHRKPRSGRIQQQQRQNRTMEPAKHPPPQHRRASARVMESEMSSLSESFSNMGRESSEQEQSQDWGREEFDEFSNSDSSYRSPQMRAKREETSPRRLNLRPFSEVKEGPGPMQGVEQYQNFARSLMNQLNDRDKEIMQMKQQIAPESQRNYHQTNKRLADFDDQSNRGRSQGGRGLREDRNARRRARSPGSASS
ncbi:MAG: hypothetical protein GY818_19225, partial [Planctomycetaceae bacterium]|nr:hypothetical protein [Planctomycetaceae bacterium]